MRLEPYFSGNQVAEEEAAQPGESLYRNRVLVSVFDGEGEFVFANVVTVDEWTDGEGNYRWTTEGGKEISLDLSKESWRIVRERL